MPWKEVMDHVKEWIHEIPFPFLIRKDNINKLLYENSGRKSSIGRKKKGSWLPGGKHITNSVPVKQKGVFTCCARRIPCDTFVRCFVPHNIRELWLSRDMKAVAKISKHVATNQHLLFCFHKNRERSVHFCKPCSCQIPRFGLAGDLFLICPDAEERGYIYLQWCSNSFMTIEHSDKTLVSWRQRLSI